MTAAIAAGLGIAVMPGCGTPDKSTQAAAGGAGDNGWWVSAAAAAPVLPSMDGVFGPGGSDAWTAAGNYTIEKDPQIGDVLCIPPDKSLILEGQTHYSGDREYRAMVRFRPTGPSAVVYFTFARHEVKSPDPKNPALTVTKPANFQLVISGTKTPEAINASVAQDNAALFDPKDYEAKLNWAPTFSSTLSCKLKAVDQFMPGWPEDFRAQVEHDMAELPDLAHKWSSIRVELRKGSAQFWIDDRLIATKNDPAIDPEGTMQINMTAGSQLARFQTRQLDATPAPSLNGYDPILLTGYLNAKTFQGGASVKADSLPPAGQPVVVGGVPFVFPGQDIDGHDHIDLSPSRLRAANWIGYAGTMYWPMARWVGTAEHDPARIQVRVANGQFKALHLIAASAGGEDTLPVVTAVFYRPGAGFSQSFKSTVPLATARSSDAKALPVTLSDGRKANLYLVTIPLDPGVLSSFADMDIVEVELTKEVQLYRTYPDPISYGYHQGGLPSSVQVYAATLQETPIGFAWDPSPFGHVWQSPSQPVYIATVTNHTAAAQTGKLLITTRSYDGTEQTRQEVPVTLPATAPGAIPAPVQVAVNAPVNLYGYHDITATLTIAGQTWTEKRSLVELAPDTRSARYTPGRGDLFGYWSYGGGHNTPKNEYHVRLMTMAGARMCIGYPPVLPPDVQAMVDQHWSAPPSQAFLIDPQPWAEKEPYDPAKVAAFEKEMLEKVHKFRDPIPAQFKPDNIAFFTEPGISSRLSAGDVPEYWGEKPYVYTPQEQSWINIFLHTAEIAAPVLRKEFPGVKFLVPYGDPGFEWPLLRAGLPKEDIDGAGLDVPGFERIPERQLHEQSIHRLYFVKKEFEKAGIPNPDLRWIEGIFVPTEPGAVTWREQMDIYNRWSLISMAYGVTTFYSGWFAFDCGNYYGAEHYGGCGIQRRVPYCDPKPAYAAYATMTDKLNEANFDGWLKTGSLSTYALRFKKSDNKGYVYTLWTIRGKRPVTLTLDADAAVGVTDTMNNTKTVQSKNKQVTVMTDQSVIYVTFPTATGQVSVAEVGEPDNSDAQPARDAKLVADLGDGSWSFTNEHDTILETNHWAMMHYLGKFGAESEQDPAHGKVLTTVLRKQEKVHELMPWYNVLKSNGKPIVLEGAPSKLGIWVKGAGDWGRVIYVLRDAKGERWESIGYKDQFNCDDVHSWSQFNFDGWRYLTFELPGHTGWDSYRKAGTNWWRSDKGDDIVDLPLTLESIVIEQRSHIIYVNDVQPAPSDSVSFGKLYAEYKTPEDATPEAIRISRLRMPVPPDTAALPNPIADMTQAGVGAPTQITSVHPPVQEYDGTRANIDFKEVPGAKLYYLWVSGHPDGRGAVNMVPGGISNGQLVIGFRPEAKLYYWIVYTDKDGKMSKPSPVVEQTLHDTFTAK